MVLVALILSARGSTHRKTSKVASQQRAHLWFKATTGRYVGTQHMCSLNFQKIQMKTKYVEDCFTQEMTQSLQTYKFGRHRRVGFWVGSKPHIMPSILRLCPQAPSCSTTMQQAAMIP